MKRVLAFLEENNLTVDDLKGKIYFYPGAVNLMDPNSVAKLIAQLKGFGVDPALIFIDTLAKNTVGADDSNNKEMGIFVDNLSKIRDAFPYVSQVVIHHPGHSDVRRPRGAYTLMGGTDFEIRVKGKTHPEARTIECVRQHEGPCFKPMTFTTREVGPSLTVVPTVAPAREASANSQPPAQTSANAEKALEVLKQAGPKGLTWGEWKASSEKVGLTRSTFSKARDRLNKDRRVRQIGETYYAVEEGQEGFQIAA
jgi:hypothetical protein